MHTGSEVMERKIDCAESGAEGASSTAAIITSACLVFMVISFTFGYRSAKRATTDRPIFVLLISAARASASRESSSRDFPSQKLWPVCTRSVVGAVGWRVRPACTCVARDCRRT